MKYRGAFFAILAILTLASAAISHAALNLEGQSGIFLNALAYPLAAGKLETSAHAVDLDTLGSVSTFNLTTGLKSNFELGYTKVVSAVTSVQDQNILHAKWLFLPESKSVPALAVWAANRNVTGLGTTQDWGVAATKALTIGGHTTVVDVGTRSTRGLGLGLFGFTPKREWELEGSLALFITKKLAVATEFKQQIGAKTWTDYAIRYQASDKLNLDAGIANLNSALNNQVALAATWSL
jgi:hypothetical protein